MKTHSKKKQTCHFETRYKKTISIKEVMKAHKELMLKLSAHEDKEQGKSKSV